MKKHQKIFITGGAGYVGTMLTNYLLDKGYLVTVLDLMLYEENIFTENPNLKVVKGDIRDQKLLKDIIPGHDVLIHLACISNDPSFELNPVLGKSINLLPFEPLVRISKESKVKKFIYASSSSVYGLSDEKDINEEVILKPLTDYSKYKAECEKILNSFASNNFCVTTLRPATVCGYSKRQRLDVVVNILTNLAFNKREITVFGGKQLRPNIHIKDMVRSYELIIETDSSKINKKIYNVGFENKTVEELSLKVLKIIGTDVKIKQVETDDNRSYHISSKKIENELNFKPKFTIDDAINDLKDAFTSGLLPNSLTDSKYFNIKKMQLINLK